MPTRHHVLPLALALLAAPLTTLPSQQPGRTFTRTLYLEDSVYTSANVSAGDVNGDGHLDLVLAKGRHWPLVDRVHLGDGAGRFTRAYDLGVASDRTYSTLLADMDGDGDLDVVVSNDRPDPKLVYLNRGDGTFTVGSTWGEAAWSTRQVQVADLDGDGVLDLIVANRSGSRPGASYICLGVGGGRLQDPCRQFANESSTSITPADMNGDGLIDLVVPHRDGGQGHVYLQQRGGDSLAFTRVPFGEPNATIRMTVTADLDRDGRLDIVAIDEERGARAYFARGDGAFSDATPLGTTGGRPYALAVADMDADGHADVIVGYVERQPEVLYNDGTGRAFTRVTFGDAEGAAYGFAIADLDRDGALDIAIARSDARNVVYFGTPASAPASASAGSARAATVNPIASAALQRHLRALTDSALEGRGAGYVGDSLAAAYVSDRFRAAGLEPAGEAGSFLQSFPLHARRPTRPFEVLRSRNVVGLLPGSDPRLRDEIVVLGAHLDGQGMSGQADMGRRIPDGTPATAVYASANDNGAAVAALLSIAEQLAAAPTRPKRTVLFVAFGAEEHGLVGSLHYVAHPVRPWDRHVAMINLEMIGWEADRDVNVRATATSRDWGALLDSATAYTGLPTTRNQPALTNDTDHYGFGVRGVPSVHYGVGGARDHYHATTDTEDRIVYAALARRAWHALTLTRLAADAPRRLSADWVHPPDLGLTHVALTTAEYAAAGIADSAGALKVNAVASGLAAHAAGVRAGDLLLAVNGRTWRRNQSGGAALAQAVASADDSGRITLTVVRDGVTREVTLPR